MTSETLPERPSKADIAETVASQSRLDRLSQNPWVRRGVPIVSLAVGVASAMMMDRTPEHARLVAGGALLVWLSLSIRSVFAARRSKQKQEAPETPSQLSRVVQFSAIFATQSLVQLCFFFPLPFFLAAASKSDPGHLIFMGIYVLLAVSSLWDPWTEWLLRRRGLALLLPTIASFLGLSVVLPGFDFDNRRALWTAALCAAAGAFAATLVSPFAENLGQRLKHATLAALVPVLFLALGGARLIPAAPMRLVHAAFGTTRQDHWVEKEYSQLRSAPGRLVCATALYAPAGVHETLFHVWEHNGEQTKRVPLDIIGGRKAGFRTRTWESNLGPTPDGLWTCSVVTAGGQFLGRATIRIGPEPS